MNLMEARIIARIAESAGVSPAICGQKPQPDHSKPNTPHYAEPLLVCLTLPAGRRRSQANSGKGIRAAFVIAVFLMLAGAPCLLPAQEGFSIKVDVSLVTTDVTVIGTAGSQLQPEDFVIYDNDVAQPVSYFSRDQIPLAVAIVIDRSLTVQRYMSMLQIAAVSSLMRLKPEDQVALFAFDYNVVKLNDLTEDRALIAEKIGKIKNQLGTNIYDAIYEAANYLKKKAPQRRRAIIFISDNIRYGPTGHNANNTREELLETATTLYSIKTPADIGFGMFGDENIKNYNESNTAVRRMAAETGGEVLDMQTGISIRAALEKIISNLRLQYTIGFNPSDPGQQGIFRRLAVKFASNDRCPRCQLLTRSGYYPGVSVPVPPPSPMMKKAEPVVPVSEQLLIEQSIAIAAGADLDLTDIRFTARTVQQPGADGQPYIKVDLQIDLRRIVFKPVDGMHACKLHIVVFYTDSKGKILGSERRILTGQLNDETYWKAMRSGVEFSIAVPLKVREQSLKIVVYDEESDKVGSKLVRLP
jgi:VWFA-related protein